MDRSSFNFLDLDFFGKSLSVRMFGIRIEASLISSIIVYKVEQSIFELLDALLVELLVINSAEIERDFELELVVGLLHNSLNIPESSWTGQEFIE